MKHTFPVQIPQAIDFDDACETALISGSNFFGVPEHKLRVQVTATEAYNKYVCSAVVTYDDGID
jgi:hypothetical protein